VSRVYIPAQGSRPSSCQRERRMSKPCIYFSIL